MILEKFTYLRVGGDDGSGGPLWVVLLRVPSAIVLAGCVFLCLSSPQCLLSSLGLGVAGSMIVAAGTALLLPLWHGPRSRQGLAFREGEVLHIIGLGDKPAENQEGLVHLVPEPRKAEQTDNPGVRLTVWLSENGAMGALVLAMASFPTVCATAIATLCLAQSPYGHRAGIEPAQGAWSVVLAVPISMVSGVLLYFILLSRRPRNRRNSEYRREAGTIMAKERIDTWP